MRVNYQTTELKFLTLNFLFSHNFTGSSLKKVTWGLYLYLYMKESFTSLMFHDCDYKKYSSFRLVEKKPMAMFKEKRGSMKHWTLKALHFKIIHSSVKNSGVLIFVVIYQVHAFRKDPRVEYSLGRKEKEMRELINGKFGFLYSSF